MSASDFPPGACLTIDTRDEGRCVKCRRWVAGTPASRHHRKLRSRGGMGTVQNGILLCGTGTTECHGWAHKNITEATEKGFIVPSWREPENWPLLCWRLTELGIYVETWCRLTVYGSREWITELEARNLMEVF